MMVLLDLLDRRGALKVLWVLRKRPLSFRDLGAAAGLNPSTLNSRLRELRAAGLVDRERGYRLTPSGAELMAAMKPVRSWAKAWKPPSG